MNTKFLLRWWCPRPKPQMGFTLIELLVVLVIAGILAAIAIPTLLSRANAARQAEAKTVVGQLNRAQQTFYAEHHAFAPDFEALAMQPSQSLYYDYTVVVNQPGMVSVAHHANPKMAKVRAYSGMTGVVYNQAGDVVSLQTIVCEAQDAAQPTAPAPLYHDKALTCAAGTQPLD